MNMNTMGMNIIIFCWAGSVPVCGVICVAKPW